MNGNTYEWDCVRHISNIYMYFIWSVRMLLRRCMCGRQLRWTVERIISPPAHPEIESHQSCLFNLGGFVASYKKVHLLCKALNAFSPLCFNKSDSRVSLGRAFSATNVNHGIWQNTNRKGVWLDESFQVKVGQQTGELTGMREMDCGFAGRER